MTAPPSQALVDALRTAYEQGSRLVSICSGAFALAAAGVLDGRSATTHWIYVDLLQSRYPGVEVDPAPLYVDEGNVLTSAGCAAGLDLCLHIVRSDHGAQIANDVARRGPRARLSPRRTTTDFHGTRTTTARPTSPCSTATGSTGPLPTRNIPRPEAVARGTTTSRATLASRPVTGPR